MEYKNGFSDLYDQCDKSLQTKIDQRAAVLMEKGNLAGRPGTAPLKHKLFELRARKGKVRPRFIFYFAPNREIIFVTSIFKKTKKIPKETIDNARKIKATLEANPELMNVLTQIH